MFGIATNTALTKFFFKKIFAQSWGDVAGVNYPRQYLDVTAIC
jgi:hypothetical protein